MISCLATSAELNTVENKILDVSNLVKNRLKQNWKIKYWNQIYYYSWLQ